MDNAATPLIGAAVLIPFVQTEEGPALLLEVRSLSVQQAGEICFPGGHIEAGESSVDAALREAYEEIGLPAASVRVLKELEPEPHMSRMLIHPVLAKIDPFEPEALQLLGEEVSEVFTLPMSWLLSHEPSWYDLSDPESDALPQRLRQYLKNYDYKGRKRSTFYWEYKQHGIWGLTARLLLRLVKMHKEPHEEP